MNIPHAVVKLFLVTGLIMLSACAAPVSPPSVSPTWTPLPPTATQPSPTATFTMAFEPATETPVVPETATATLTPEPTGTPTVTVPPPTPSGEAAIYVYYVQLDSGGSVACGDSLVPLNTGISRTGDVEVDVAAALKRLFVKTQYFGELVNPAYLSNIEVQSVSFKEYTGLVDVRLIGTYVRSGDRCDDSRVRAQVWTTIRQFPGVKTVYILLNDNLLGDILATGK